MDRWIFNFPPLTEMAVDVNVQIADEYTAYPKRLLIWERVLNLNGARAWYDNNRFNEVQLELYSSIFRFYGQSLLDEEVRVFASLKGAPTEEYLSIVLSDYLALQADLQNLFKLTPSKLYYINAIERRSIFIRVQCTRSRLQLVDIEPYEIPPFALFKQFPSPRVSEATDRLYRASSLVFWENIRKLNNIDPYGNLYLTRSMDLGTLRALLNNFPTYKDYFRERNQIKLILRELVELYNGMNASVEKMKTTIAERDAISRALMPDILERQDKILSSRKPEQLFVQVNTKIVKLNAIFLTFNNFFTLSSGSRNSIDINKLTDNFFYGDYLSARDSIESGLRIKLGEILNVLK